MENLTLEQLRETIRLLKNNATFRHLAENAELEIIRRTIEKNGAEFTEEFFN